MESAMMSYSRGCNDRSCAILYRGFRNRAEVAIKRNVYDCLLQVLVGDPD